MEFRRRLYFLTLILSAGTLNPDAATAKVLLRQNEALGLAFPTGVTMERRTSFLTEAQVQTVARDCGSSVDSKVWTYYVGRSTQGIAGFAYFDSHKVRTMNETVMIVLAPDATVRFVEVLAFAEPDEYMASTRWLDQFRKKALNDDLMLHRGLRNITGASITSETVTRAVRRVLAVHRVLADSRP